MLITIDGPAASGKSTVARRLAEKLDATFLDTGAMYRAVTLAAMHAGVDLADERGLVDVLGRTRFRFEAGGNKMRVEMDGRDVTEQIRAEEVTANARYIASSKAVRQRLVEMQREFAAAHERIVTEGRDQGTVAFADADMKFYLTASLDERARRRQAELEAKGTQTSVEQVRQSIEHRDISDRDRSVGPLKPAKDAVIVDTTNLTIGQVLEELLVCVKQKCSKKD